MPFSLKVHLNEIKQEERDSGCKLGDYKEFIKLSEEACRYLPQEMEVEDIDKGPSFQTIDHNASYLRTHFPSMPEDFVKAISVEVNFKFKEVTEQMKHRMNQKKEGKSMTLRRLSEEQQKIIFLAVFVGGLGMQYANVFSKGEQKQPAKLNIPVSNMLYQERDFWTNADEKIAKGKDHCESKNLFKSRHELSEVPAQI